jgi:hypothetical protein
MEEIDIIELLKRVKEGKAPKEIEINGKKLIYHQDEKYFERLYQTENNSWWINSCFIDLDTKIKILDKPIIEKFEVTDTVPLSHQFRDKINEIIDYINQNNKE